MALLLKKRHPGTAGEGEAREFSVLVSQHRKDVDRDALLIRLSRGLLARAGWKIGDRCLIGYDRGVWTLSRTTNDKEGYKVSCGENAKTRHGNIKAVLTRDDQVELGMKRGDRFQADAIEANGDRIVVRDRI
jgi:hypothetical protein